jgi:hypothetical protein
MASRPGRDPIDELARLVRSPEPGGHNVGEYVADHADVLAPLLDIQACELDAARAVVDDVTAPRLRVLLETIRGREQNRDHLRRRERSRAAAERLGGSVHWVEQRAVLDADLLFGELLADRQVRWFSFHAPGHFQTTVGRSELKASARLRSVHPDLAAWVDEAGLHVRWRGGRGGYNWFSQSPPTGTQSLVLSVLLPWPEPTRRVERGGAWLRQVLRELGYLA